MTILGPKTCLGIDIGVNDIRVVELRRTTGKLEVVQAASISVPEDGDVAAALRDFLLDTETSPGRVVGSLPTHLCSVKLAQVPKAKPADLARMVRFEAESQIPLPLSDLVWDYSVDSETGDAMCHVVIGGVRKSDVEKTLGALERAKLSPDALMVSALAAVDGVVLPKDEPILVVQVGAEWADFCTVDGDRIISYRTARVGSDELTQAFTQDLSENVEDAREIRKTRGLSPLSTLGAAECPTIEGWVEKLSLEIRRSAVSAPARESDQRPQRAVLVGEVTDVPGLADELTRRAGLQLEIGDPWAGMTISAVAEHTLRGSPAEFATATGLAKAGLEGKSTVNLMPQHRAEERTRHRKELVTLSSLGAVAVVLLMMLLGGGPGLSEKSAEFNLLKSEVDLIQRQTRQAGPNLQSPAGNVTQVVQAIQNKETCPLEILRQLSTVLPRSVWLSEYAFECNKAVVVKGSALSNSAVADAVDVLNQLDLFKDVSLDFSNLAKSSQGYEFQITCSLPIQKGLVGRSSTGKVKPAGSGKTGIVVQ